MNGETIINSVQEQSQKARVLMGAAAATIALLACSERADAIATSSEISNANGEISQRLAFSPRTGETICRVSQRSYNNSFGSQTLLVRAEGYDKNKHEWAPLPFFKQPFEVSQPDNDPTTVSTKLSTRYNPKALGRVAQKQPIRINCLSGETAIRLPLAKEIFPRK